METEIEYFKSAPPQRLLEEIVKSGTERLCALISSIILQSFNSVGHVIKEEKGKTELLADGRTSNPFYEVISEK